MPPRVTRSLTRRSLPDTEDDKTPQKRGTKRIVPDDDQETPSRQSKRARGTEANGIKKESLNEDNSGLAHPEPSKAAVKKVVKEEEEEEKEEIETTTKKTTRKKTKKTSKEEIVEMKPLAPRTQGLRMYVGAHVSAAKGIHNAVTNCQHVGGNAFALFLKSQRKWNNPPLQDEHRDQFRKHCVDHTYDASKFVLPHGSYLVNLAQEDPAKAKQAYASFMDDLKRCEELGIGLYNFHPGAMNQSTLSSSLTRLSKSLISALDSTKTVTPVLETTCGHGTSIGGPLTHFRDLFALIPQTYHPRLGVCLDTCHSFAAGYDLRDPRGWNDFMREFDEVVGLKFLRALHLNDSKTPRGSRRDLHANIGTGFLGLRGFHNVMNDGRLEGLPMILETPIDRPVEVVKREEEGEEGSSVNEESSKKKKSKAAKEKGSKDGKKPAMVEDKSVWAREIKLLESLIGMDTESEEFLALEKKLAEEGREEREKHQALFDKKVQQNNKQQNAKERKPRKKKVKESDESCGDGSEG